MMRLIGSEFKKIFKSRVNVILLVVLMLFSGYCIYNSFTTRTGSVGIDYMYQTTDGEDVSGNAYYRIADQIHHGYAGNLNIIKIDEMRSDFTKIADANRITDVDDDYMRYIYGEDYVSLLEHAKNGDYTFDELQLETQSMKTNGYSMDEVPNSKNVKAYFPIYYKEDRVLALYNTIYTGYYNIRDTRDDAVEYKSDFTFDFLTRNVMDKLDHNRETFLEERYGNDSMIPDKVLNEDALAYYNDKYYEASSEYDSVIGNTLFVNALMSIEFTSLIILILILANTFAMEKHYKIDQVLVPTTCGWGKVTMAKVATGCFTALAILAVQVVAALIVSLCILPMRDLGLVYMGQAGVHMNYNVLEYVFTYREIIVSGLALMTLASIATALLTMLGSYLTKSRFLTAIPLLLIVLLCGSMNLFELLLPGGAILDAFVPSHMYHFTEYFQVDGMLMNVWNIFDQMITLKDIIMMFWFVVIVLMIGGMYLHSRKHHTVKTC